MTARRPLITRRTSRLWYDCFSDFISYMTITSKELEQDQTRPLLDIMYNAQHRFCEEICDGLDHGIHDFKCLKGRQLGISTVSLAMDVFWLSMHDKLQGALITDDDANKEKFRILLEQYIESLPRGLRVGIKAHNRNNLVLMNGSVLDYMVAGTRHGKESLGTSRALNFVHATEMCNWGKDAGIENLISSLAEHHPHRLYIWESTAKGFNLWWDMWCSAKKDKLTQKTFFIGWWAKEDYAIARGTDLFEHYGTDEPDEEEELLIDAVHKKYGFTIQPEQLAWHRYMRTAKILDEDRMNEQYPWHEDQAFIATGKSFFPLRRISADHKFLEDMPPPAKAYRYHMGDNFLATEIETLYRIDDNVELVIYEEPNPRATYVCGMDPAYGRNDNKNNHSIEIFRCFADRLVQVAEFATSDCDTYQAAWVLAHIAGAYRNIRINLEVTGPGHAIHRELKTLKQLLASGYMRGMENHMGLLDVFANVSFFLYHRYDSMGGSYMWNWKTNSENKQTIMNQMRDNYALRILTIRSRQLLHEMERVVQNGVEIEASGKANDDRVFATALANRCWIDWVRPGLIADNRTYDKVMAEEKAEAEEPRATYIAKIVEDFFRQQEAARVEREYENENQGW
jgi:hypothetical protein